MDSSDDRAEPGPAASDLGHALASIGVGEETLREPLRLVPFEHWVGHIPFAFWLVAALRPRVLVELGTHRGNSYLAFCQAIEATRCGTRAYAVDLWEGDLHMAREEGLYEELGAYHDPLYGHFSSLVRASFADARALFADGSIDLLHIDGTHTYEAAKQDFETWAPALSDSAVVLFHDINVRRAQYGVWKLWEELARDRPHFAFYHSYGLGVLGVGATLPDPLSRLFSHPPDGPAATHIRSYFATRGAAGVARLTRQIDDKRFEDSAAEAARLAERRAERLASREAEIDRLHAKTRALVAASDRSAMLSGIMRDVLKGRALKIARLTAAGERQAAILDALRHAVATNRIDMDPAGARRAASGQAEHGAGTTSPDAPPAAVLRAVRKARGALRRIQARSAAPEAADEAASMANRVRATGMFDADYYLANNPDIAEDGVDPALHFAVAGWIEGRKPNAAFDPGFYLATNVDVAATGENPLIHYAEHGLKEGREPLPEAAVDPAVHPQSGRRPDENLSAEDLTLIRDVEETGLFDAAYYAAMNPDLVENQANLALHFARVGWREGRKPNPSFDPLLYVARNVDVAASIDNPLVHFAERGLVEGRPFGPVDGPDGLGASLAVPARGARDGLPSPSDAVEARWPLDHMPDLFELRAFVPSHRIAVVAHVFYPELWDELEAAILRMPVPYDLFVTLVKPYSDHRRDEILARFPAARVFVFPNRGRDVLPFTTIAATGALTAYDLVCKIHTKRSPHRGDGDVWRRHLVSSILPDPDGIKTLLDAFAADPDLGMVVADGQIFQSEEAWVSNTGHLKRLLPLMGFDPSRSAGMPFAGGSMFWLRAFVLHDLVGLAIPPEAYEPEPIAIDGTLAHAVERLFSVACHGAGLRIEQASLVPAAAAAARAGRAAAAPAPVPRIVAFYLPQFHPIPENDRWWGRGFTEWTNVTKAQPLFPGHRQPRLPGELGFTDLRLPETRAAQAELARAHGISAFCYYYYWFGENRRLLHRPLDEVLASGAPDFPFMICWANEPWSRNWDGVNKEILVPQDYEEGWAEAFAREVAPILKDPRYVRLDGPERRPMLMIYRIMHVPDPAAAMARLRAALRELGVGEVHLSAGWLTLGDDEEVPADAAALGLDSFFEFPPHRIPTVSVPAERKPPPMTGGLYDYGATVDAVLESLAKDPDDGRHHALMMGWDNTARRGAAAHVFHGATPGHFRRWLRGLLARRPRAPDAEERLVFVNAWNEWAEGTCLEPDRDFGRGWLAAVRDAGAERPNDPWMA